MFQNSRRTRATRPGDCRMTLPMTRRRVIAAAAAAMVLAGLTAAPSSVAEVAGTGEPVTLHLALDQDMTTLLPMDSNIADNIWVLDIVYDGLFRYDPETTEPYPYVAESIETTDNKCGRSRSSRI